MKVNFILNDNYLLVHTFARSFWNISGEERVIRDVQEKAWQKSPQLFDFLSGKQNPQLLETEKQITQTANQIPNYLDELKTEKEFERLKKETVEYKDSVESEWQNNFEKTYRAIRETTRLSEQDLDKHFTVYITHPELRNGQYFGSGVVAWGSPALWDNYATVYIWHEILHEYFELDDVSHSIIELITDNELRVRLNGGKYPPFEGHEYLNSVKESLLPHWKKYLEQNEVDIYHFRDEMKKVINK